MKRSGNVWIGAKEAEMLRAVKDLHGYAIGATDGAVGHVVDFYLDDEDWVVRYLVVDTGTWLAGRHVLIPAVAAGEPVRMAEVIPVSITKEQVKNSPDIDTQKPVSRQHETEYLGYYGYPLYWRVAGVWAVGAHAATLTTKDAVRADMEVRRRAMSAEGAPDSHLRSCNTVRGYHIHATDGDIGHI
jgi:hypothetical protein